jgi:putative acetyltransferase
MRAELRLRAYRSGDFERTIEIWMHAWQTAMPEIAFAKRREWWRHRWEHELVPNNSITIAETDAGPVGFVVIDPASGWLDQLAVDPALWGNGVAKALLEEAKRVSPSLIRLDVNQTNARAIGLYERQGFYRAGTSVNRNSGAPTYIYEWKSQTATAPN